MHYMAGGDIHAIGSALIFAKERELYTDFNRLCAIDLATKGTENSLLSVLEETCNERTYEFDEYLAEPGVKIEGFTMSGEKLNGTIKITYYPPLGHVFGGNYLATLHDRVACALSVAIHTARDTSDLRMRKSEIELRLLNVAMFYLKSII